MGRDGAASGRNGAASGRDGTASRRNGAASGRGWRLPAVFLAGLLPFGLFAALAPEASRNAVLALTGVLVAYVAWSAFVAEYAPGGRRLFTAPQLVVLLVAVVACIVSLGWLPPSPMAVVHLSALALFAWYYWVVGLLAVVHRPGQNADAEPFEPSVTVIIPAYNESGYIQQTVRSVLAADYPAEKRDVVVVDDGSQDDTFREALVYESEDVTVVTKTNGGKCSALNYALLFADGDIVATVDADSVLHRDALRNLVAPFRDDRVGAAASNVLPENHDTLLERCQYLEYLVGMNVYRRLFDRFGAVTIVPGCLGAFRRDVLRDVHDYDPDTLTEDFDATVKVLKSGHRVVGSDAVVYTEVPVSWRDLASQRLRWYRGNVMTVRKHADVLRDSRQGFLHRLALPMRALELFVLPIVSWLVAGTAAWLVWQGNLATVAALFGFFAGVTGLIALLALEAGDEDWRLAAYAPLFVVGYKQFQDALALRSVLDVALDRDVSWTRASRASHRDRSP